MQTLLFYVNSSEQYKSENVYEHSGGRNHGKTAVGQAGTE